MSTRTAAAQRLQRKYGPGWAATLEHPGLTFRRVQRAIYATRQPWRVAAWTAGGAFTGVILAELLVLAVRGMLG
jgi:hypothetical protein